MFHVLGFPDIPCVCVCVCVYVYVSVKECLYLSVFSSLCER